MKSAGKRLSLFRVDYEVTTRRRAYIYASTASEAEETVRDAPEFEGFELPDPHTTEITEVTEVPQT